MQTADYLKIFRANENQPVDLTPDGYKLTVRERIGITRSIQSFQLGECSEGSSLKRNAELLADPDYSEAIHLLVKEENRHSAYLASFMRDQHIPKTKKRATATSFRFLKNLSGLEWRLRVLITAELVALSYYEALSEATSSKKLKRICRQMLKDEEMHVAFQMHHIQRLSRTRAKNFAHDLFTGVTAAVVYLEHRRVLESYSLLSYVKRVRRDFHRVLRSVSLANETPEGPRENLPANTPATSYR